MLSVALLALTLTATPAPRVAFLGLASGEGVSEAVATSLSDALSGELRRQWRVELITPRELTAVMSVERQKALLGCDSSGCVAELAGALDVQEVVTGSAARLGESWLLELQRVDAKKGVALAHASRRTKGSVDALLDALPPTVAELVGGAKPVVVETKHRGDGGSAALISPEVAPPREPLSPSIADIPLTPRPDLSKHEVLTDGEGLILLVEPFAISDGLFFTGTEDALYAQRVIGGGSEAKVRYDFVFWDPRMRSRAEAQFAFRDGKHVLTCGERSVSLKPVEKKKAAAIRKRARLFDVRWQRYAYAIARDDEGTYFVLDRARVPDDSDDYRLFVGTRGALTGMKAVVLSQDDAGEIFKTAQGRLKLLPREQKAIWNTGTAETTLSQLDVQGQARFIYTQLGVYTGTPLGTPCD